MSVHFSAIMWLRNSIPENRLDSGNGTWLAGKSPI